MKILWIEDFGAGNPEPEGLAKPIFNSILDTNRDIFNEIDGDEDFDRQFTDLVHSKSLHDIHICRNYREWKKRFKDAFDYDIVLIDINLEKGTNKGDIPIGYNDDFHLKAGFYIYHEILGKGFPDQNIAFFTGESGSFNSFKYFCISNSIPVPKNVFEKKESDYIKMGAWLKNKQNIPFIQFRRGVIECCTEISSILNGLDDKKIDQYIIFNNNLKPNTNKLEFSDIKLYFEVLINFFPFSSLASDNKFKYYGFVKEISGLWERSRGWLNKDSSFKNEDEFRFKDFSQRQMKLLRNWTAHNQLSTDLSEKELSFYFITAIRGLIDLNINQICRYEKILLSIINDVPHKLDEIKIKADLADSWCSLRKVYHKKVNPSRIDFVDILSEVHKQKNYDISESAKYFYQNFWHSIYSANLVINILSHQNDTVQLKIRFNYKEITKGIVRNIQEAIYSESF